MQKLILRVFAAVVFAATIFYFMYDWYWNKMAEKRRFQEQLGTYTLDIGKTKLGNYSKDSLKYKNLKISFTKDSTFHLNMEVPFIHDTVGKWNAGGNGLEDWNWLYFKSWDYSKYEKNKGNQFDSPFTKDSIFYINAAYPQTGREPIPWIFFKKNK